MRLTADHAQTVVLTRFDLPSKENKMNRRMLVFCVGAAALTIVAAPKMTNTYTGIPHRDPVPQCVSRSRKYADRLDYNRPGVSFAIEQDLPGSTAARC
jgi:hypothetical protein